MARLVMLRGMINLSVRTFMKEVYLNVIFVTVISMICPYILTSYVKLNNIVNFLLVCIISVTSAVVSIYVIGCNKHDKEMIHKAIAKLVNYLK